MIYLLRCTSIQQDGSVLLDSGAIFFSPRAVADLLRESQVGGVTSPNSSSTCWSRLRSTCAFIQPILRFLQQTGPLSRSTERGLDRGGGTPVRHELYTGESVLFELLALKKNWLRHRLDLERWPPCDSHIRNLLQTCFWP